MNELEVYMQQVEEAAAYIAQRLPRAEAAVVLGSGLAELAEMIENPVELTYEEIPHFPKPTVVGHSGKLLAGTVGGKMIYAFSGRFHYYEGHDPLIVTLPMRVLGLLKVPVVILTNAAGGINLGFIPGDLMLITDHINLTGYNPLRGVNCDAWGTRFPDMSQAYDSNLRQLALSIAEEQGFKLQQGVYCGIAGPNFETPAEIRMFRTMGADACGMSTVAETLVARHMNIRVLGISCITNMAAGVSPMHLTHEEVFETGRQAGERFSKLVAEFITRL